MVCSQQLTKADRQTTADIRQLKDSYEQQLAHGIKVSKVEVHRLVSRIFPNQINLILGLTIYYGPSL